MSVRLLDALRGELRKRDYLSILFDFSVPAARDITETVSLLARMSRFIIADLTDPSSIPKELEAIVPQLAVPVQPLIEGLSRPYAMFKDYWKYEWVLPPYQYDGLEPLLATLAERVIAPAEAKVKALEERRRMIEAELTKRHLKDCASIRPETANTSVHRGDLSAPHLCSAHDGWAASLMADRNCSSGWSGRSIINDVPRPAPALLFDETCHCGRWYTFVAVAKNSTTTDLGGPRCNKLRIGSKSSACPSTLSALSRTESRSTFSPS